jgi:ribosomal protein S12 methylthiotransferase accessory factor
MTRLETGLPPIAGMRRGRRSGTLAGLLAPGAAPVAKGFTDGTHRREAPARTLARVMPRLSGFGVTRVARLTGFDRTGIEVFAAVRPNARGLSVANGKGLDPAAARVSAVMEAIERWHAERPSVALRFGEPADLGRFGRAVDAAALPRRRAVPPGPLAWAEATDLATGAPALVPFDLVHTCWLADLPESPFLASTNGLASGTDAVEAALHALCELIEGDSLALFERLPPEARAARRIDPRTIDDPAVAAMVAGLAARGFALALWDATTDIGVASLLCALTDLEAPRTPPGFGSGCHPERGVAALRAITEAAQTRAIAIAGTRDDLGPDLYAPGVAVRFRRAMEGAGSELGRPWAALPTAARDCLRADLRAVVAAVAAAGCGPVLAVDLSRAPRLAVIRLVVPGLEPAAPAGESLSGERAARPEAHLA